MGLESGFGDRRGFSEEIAWEQSRERSEGTCQARAGDAAGRAGALGTEGGHVLGER